MTSPENILFYLSPDHDAQVRDIFAQLANRGFPQQHQTPHISVTFAPHLPQRTVDLAATLLPVHLPATFSRRGFVTFGTRSKQTVAWMLETDLDLEETARQISATNPEGRGQRWIPHLTLGLRLPRRMVGDYINALDEIASPYFKEITADRAGYWRPAQQHLQLFEDPRVGA